MKKWMPTNEMMQMDDANFLNMIEIMGNNTTSTLLLAIQWQRQMLSMNFSFGM